MIRRRFWTYALALLWAGGALVAATPAGGATATVTDVTFTARSDGGGYVVRVQLAGTAEAYGMPRRVDAQTVEWTLYNAALSDRYTRSAPRGPVTDYTVARDGAHLRLRMQLDATRALAVDVYRDRASPDLLMNLSYVDAVPNAEGILVADGSSRPSAPAPAPPADAPVASTDAPSPSPPQRSPAGASTEPSATDRATSDASGERTDASAGDASARDASARDASARDAGAGEARPATGNAPDSDAAGADASAAASGSTAVRTAQDRWRLDTVVIDPGHGGKDPGATANGLQEKDIVLSVAKKLGGYLEDKLGLNVVYTRTGDRFIALEDRGRRANQARAKLFISLHVNAARSRSAKGTETYFRGRAKTEAARKVMERENSVIRYEENPEEYEAYDDQLAVRQTLAQSMYLQKSEELAGFIEDQFANRVHRKSRGVHQAGFYVLWSASMPSVLVELGFLTNPSEARFLKSERGQTYMASALFRAVRTYKKQYEKGIETTALRN